MEMRGVMRTEVMRMRIWMMTRRTMKRRLVILSSFNSYIIAHAPFVLFPAYPGPGSGITFLVLVLTLLSFSARRPHVLCFCSRLDLPH